jgi:hypothetical protein
MGSGSRQAGHAGEHEEDGDMPYGMDRGFHEQRPFLPTKTRQS